MVDEVLVGLDGELAAMYPSRGRPSVPPEMLLKASVLMALYSIRSERAFCERLNFDMLFKWFLGLRIDERGFDASTFSKNRRRLLDHDIADRFFAAVVDAARLRRYCSSGHFSVDGTLLEAWASHKSFKPRTTASGPDSGEPQRTEPNTASGPASGEPQRTEPNTASGPASGEPQRTEPNTASGPDSGEPQRTEPNTASGPASGEPQRTEPNTASGPASGEPQRTEPNTASGPASGEPQRTEPNTASGPASGEPQRTEPNTASGPASGEPQRTEPNTASGPASGEPQRTEPNTASGPASGEPQRTEPNTASGPASGEPQRTEPNTAGGRNQQTDWRGARRRNDTHASATDPEARLYRKSAGTAATLCFMGHVLTENRNGLIVDAELTTADGRAERDTAAEMLDRAPKRKRRRTVGADRNYDTKDFVADARAAGFTPHVAQNTTRRRSAIDGRTTRHAGYAISQRTRKRVEEPFGWIKTIAGGRKLRHRGRQRNRAWFLIAAASYNLVRIARLDTPTT